MARTAAALDDDERSSLERHGLVPAGVEEFDGDRNLEVARSGARPDRGTVVAVTGVEQRDTGIGDQSSTVAGAGL